MGNFGIEQTSMAVIALVNLGEDIEEAYEDKKFTATEGIMIAVKNQPGITNAIMNANELQNEILDLDTEERQKLDELIAVELDIPNSDVDDYIEAALATALGLVNLIGLIRKSKKAKKDQQ